MRARRHHKYVWCFVVIIRKGANFLTLPITSRIYCLNVENSNKHFFDFTCSSFYLLKMRISFAHHSHRVESFPPQSIISHVLSYFYFHCLHAFLHHSCTPARLIFIHPFKMVSRSFFIIRFFWRKRVPHRVHQLFESFQGPWVFGVFPSKSLTSSSEIKT